MGHHVSHDTSTGKIDARLCQMCSAEMVAARVTPALLGINARTFECLRCNHVEKVLEATDPM